MSLREAYKKKLTAQAQKQRARVNALKARVKRVADNGQSAGHEEIARAEKRLGQFASKLKRFAGAGYQALGEIRGGVGRALDDLGTSTRRAASRISTAAEQAQEAPRNHPPRRSTAARSRASAGTAARRAAQPKARQRQTRPPARPVRRPTASAQ
jgi:outer membrane murein-binding lipoprotein Lpp